MPWLIINTKKNRITQAVEFFKLLGISSYVPKLESTKGIKYLFHNKIFIFFENQFDLKEINKNPFTGNLFRAFGKIVEISDKEIQVMINHIESNYDETHFNNLSKNEIIKIQHGILEGFVVKFLKSSGNKKQFELNNYYLSIKTA